MAQARTQLETVRAQLVDVGVARAQFEHAIGTIANYKLSDFSIPPSPLDLPLPKIPTGVPSQLLERRPDIAAAERRAAAANAQIGIAVSAFYPTINLSGSGGFESLMPAPGFRAPARCGPWARRQRSCSSTPASATPSPTRPATPTRPRPPAIESTSSRPSTTWKTSSPACGFWNRNRAWSRRPSTAAQHSFDISNQRYKGGVTSYLEVLTAEATLLQNQRTAIDLQTRQFVASVGLVRALGGGWDAAQLPK